MPPLFAKEPEQTEPVPLLVNTPKKKRTKVTDTRLSPRAARALLQDSMGGPHGSPQPESMKGSMRSHCSTPQDSEPFPSPFHHHPPPLVPASLPTSVAIPNPSLQHSEVLAMYSHVDHPMFPDLSRGFLRAPAAHSPSGSPSMGHTPGDMHMPVKEGNGDSFDSMHDQYTYDGHPMVSFCHWLCSDSDSHQFILMTVCMQLGFMHPSLDPSLPKSRHLLAGRQYLSSQHGAAALLLGR
jgi:hypothetical protein